MGEPLLFIVRFVLAPLHSAIIRLSIARQTSKTVLTLAISRSAVLCLIIIYSAVCLLRFMDESPSPSSRMTTFIHLGPIVGCHAIFRQADAYHPSIKSWPPIPSLFSPGSPGLSSAFPVYVVFLCCCELDSAM